MRAITALALLVFATTASAQTVATHAWSRGTTLEAFVGTATTPKTMATYGAAVGWELTHRFDVQGLGGMAPAHGHR